MDSLKLNRNKYIDNLKLFMGITNEFGLPSEKNRKLFIKTVLKYINNNKFNIGEHEEKELVDFWELQCKSLDIQGCKELAICNGGVILYRELNKVKENITTEKDLSNFLEKFEDTVKKKQVDSSNIKISENQKGKKRMGKDSSDIMKKLLEDKLIDEFDEVYIKGYNESTGEIRRSGRIFYKGKELKLEGYVINVDSIPNKQNEYQRVVHKNSGKTIFELINGNEQITEKSTNRFGLKSEDVDSETDFTSVYNNIDDAIKTLERIKNSLNAIEKESFEDKPFSEKMRAIADRADKKTALNKELETNIKASLTRINELIKLK